MITHEYYVINGWIRKCFPNPESKKNNKKNNRNHIVVVSKSEQYESRGHRVAVVDDYKFASVGLFRSS